MRVSELLNVLAKWIENPNNEMLLLAEADDKTMEFMAKFCVSASQMFKNAAQEIDDIEPQEESLITSDSIESIAELATILDSSGDPELKKQASVLDELILGIASSNSYKAAKAEKDYRLDELKKKYDNSKTLLDLNKISDYEKAIKDSKMTVEPGPIYGVGLSTRYCPDHAGVSTMRVGEGLYQCELDKKLYDYRAGYTLENGVKVPGGSVENQTSIYYTNPSNTIFSDHDSRIGRLQTNKA